MASTNRNKMRVVFVHGKDRLQMDIDDSQTVGHVTEKVRQRFHLSSDERSIGSQSHERKILSLSFAGATLDPRWRLVDIGIRSGCQPIKAYFREETKPSLLLYQRFSGETTAVLRPINLMTCYGRDLRTIVSRLTGLPVGAFRLTTSAGVDIYDCHTLDSYGLELGSNVYLEVWDGWTELLGAAISGLPRQVMDKLDVSDDAIMLFQLRVVLYIAAHYGHVELAVNLIRGGSVKCNEPVGEHPTRSWTGHETRHVDSYKTPIHEAADAGQLAVLRYFVLQDVCTVLALDGNHLTPLNVALRNKHHSCAQFLLTKQWSQIPYTKNSSISLSTYARMRRWAEQSRDRVFRRHGASKSSIRQTTQCRNLSTESILVGHGVQLDGFTRSMMTSQHSNRNKVNTKQGLSSVRLAQHQPGTADPEIYFKTIDVINSLNMMYQHNQPNVTTTARQQRNAERNKLGHDVTADDAIVKNNNDNIVMATNGVHRPRCPPCPLQAQQQQLTSSQSEQRELGTSCNRHSDVDTRSRSRDVTSPDSFQSNGGKGFYINTSNYSETDDVITNSSKKKKKMTICQNKNNVHEVGGSTVVMTSYKNSNKKILLSSSLDNLKQQQQQDKAMLAVNTQSNSFNLIHDTSHLRLPPVTMELRTAASSLHGNQHDEPLLSTRRSFERERGMKSRDFAVRCLALAQNFHERPWLVQVKQAVTMATVSVRRVYGNEPHLFSDMTASVPRQA